MSAIDRLRRGYTGVALLLLNTCLLLVVLNAVLVLGSRLLRATRPEQTEAERQLFASQQEHFFPAMSIEEIRRLKDETWTRTFAYEPFTNFKERPYAGRYVNVHAAGFRVTKDQGPWPPERAKHFTVFMFGGSTTFGYGVPDDQTIASYLQDSLVREGLPRPPRVYNFGRAYYYSTQERILFEQLLAAGFVPDLAVFLDGLNEFRYAWDEPEFSPLLHAFVEGPVTTNPFERLPMVRAANAVWQRFAARRGRPPATEATDAPLRPNPPARLGAHPLPERWYDDLVGSPQRSRERDDASVVRSIIDRYATTTRIVGALADAFGIGVVSIWQPVAAYKYDLAFYPFKPLRFDKYLAPGYAHLDDPARQQALGPRFGWCADVHESVQELLYVDRFHYAPHGSELVARCIVDVLQSRRLLAARAWP